MEENHVNSFYELDSSEYDNRWIKRGGMKTAQTQMRIVSTLIESWSAKSILELGCGSGRFSANVAAKGRPAILLDLTMGMLGVSKAKVLKASLPFAGTRGSIYKLPFEQGTFDAALSINVFNHLDNLQNSLLEANRVLKAGGEFLINFSNLNSYFWLMALFINHRHKSVGRDVYSVWLTVREMKALLADAGFRILEVVGNVYVPLHMDYPIVREFPIMLDLFSRNSRLKWFSPSIFFLCQKD